MRETSCCFFLTIVRLRLYCAPLVADFVLFCRVRDFMLSLSDNSQSEVIEPFSSTTRCLDDYINV